MRRPQQAVPDVPLIPPVVVDEPDVPPPVDPTAGLQGARVPELPSALPGALLIVPELPEVAPPMLLPPLPIEREVFEPEFISFT
jgi:hypothetical protein